MEVTVGSLGKEDLRRDQVEAILGYVADGISVITRDMEISYANSGLKSLFGPGIIGQPCYWVYHGLSKPCTWCPATETFVDGKVHTTDVTSPDGVIWQITTSPLFDEKGSVSSVVEVVRDISCLMKTEKALQESEEKYRGLIEDINDAVYEIDEKGSIRYISPIVEAISGYHPSELIGRTFTEFVHQKDLERVTKEFQEVVGGDITVIECRMFAKSGQFRWVRTSSRPVFVGNTLVALRGTLTDITQKKRLEAQLFQAQKMETVGRLAGGVAHDFNNVLMTIQGNAELASMDTDSNGPIHRRLQEIMKASERAAGLTAQLLAFSRRQVLEPRVIDLNQVLFDMNTMLRHLIGEDIEVVVLPSEDLKSVKVDPTQIEQVIVNLAVNARDAMPGGGKLTLETANVTLGQDFGEQHSVDVPPGEYVMLAVSDTGIGMTREVKKHLFEPFFTTKESGKGTGLGLATCYGIVKQSGGFIWACSEPGHGAAFKIYLPAEKRKAEDQAILDDSDSIPGGNETILLVEDEPSVRKVTAHILAGLGYTLLEAADGEDALFVASENRSIDLLLTDVVMPQMNGRVLADRMRAERPGLKVLFFSGYSDEETIHPLDSNSGVFFLQKPFSSPVLARKVREVLNQ
jgi:PAS domain S-box-containing protein